MGLRLLLQTAGAVGISVVTIEESLRGRLARIARAGECGVTRIRQYALLAQTIQVFLQFSIVPYDQSAEAWFQRLRQVRIGTQDRKIASIALASNLILVTRNRRDFSRVPGLTLDDWSV